MQVHQCTCIQTHHLDPDASPLDPDNPLSCPASWENRALAAGSLSIRLLKVSFRLPVSKPPCFSDIMLRRRSIMLVVGRLCRLLSVAAICCGWGWLGYFTPTEGDCAQQWIHPCWIHTHKNTQTLTCTCTLTTISHGHSHMDIHTSAITTHCRSHDIHIMYYNTVMDCLYMMDCLYTHMVYLFVHKKHTHTHTHTHTLTPMQRGQGIPSIRTHSACILTTLHNQLFAAHNRASIINCMYTNPIKQSQ